MLTLTAKQIPIPLQQLAQPVKQLHVTGEGFNELMTRPRLAIVGSRKLTPYGRGVTQQLASSLAAKGVVIVSGLALGADSVAHQACLDAGGQTIAVLPCGPDRIYPSTHTNLASNILKQTGLLITEYYDNTDPYPSNFLERNRIIAALSDGVLVTEAAIRSGSLNTANHALQLGIPVFAVPGNITSPLSAGCNNLIKAGAIPVMSEQDILEELNWQDLNGIPKKVVGSTDDERTIITLLEAGLTDGAEMLMTSSLNASAFNQALTMLEITGKIHPTGANHWSL